MSTTAAMTSWLGPLGPGFIGSVDEKSRQYLRWISARCRLNSVDGFEDNRRTDQPDRADEGRTQTGDHAIRGTEIGRSFSRPIEDQQLVLGEHGFGHHRAGAALTGESGNGRQQMQKQYGQIAHRRILPTSRHSQESPRSLEFAMHRIAIGRPTGRLPARSCSPPQRC